MPFASKAQQGFLEAHPEKIGGRAKLKEWEHATNFKSLPEKKGMEKKSKAPKHGIRHTHIEHHEDGSKTIRHTHADGKEHSHAVADHEEMMSHLEDHLGAPNAGEEPAAAPPPAPGAAPAPPMAQ